MNDDRAEIGLKKSKSVTFDQIFPLVGYTEGSSYHGLPASKRLELIRDWISAVSEMNELPDVDRVAFGMFLYSELDAVHLSRKRDDRQMKRRTQGKEVEISTKLPFVRDLVRNGHLPPRKQIPEKTQRVFDRLGKDLHIYFKLNTSTLFGEDEHLDFPVCWMTEYISDLQQALDNMHGYLAPDRHFGNFSTVTIGSDYTKDLSRYMQKRFGKKLSECHFKIVKTEPVWDWPTSYMTILAEHPEPWMLAHNAMLKNLKDSYPPELVEAKERAHREYLDSLRAGF